MESPRISPSHQQNRQAWDRKAVGGDRLARPARDGDFQNPLATVDGAGWLGGDIRGRQLLCLAAGGGRQSALYAAAGAIVTVLDISDEMLRLDRQVAAERGFNIRVVQGSMDRLDMFADGQFEIVIHPVSTCYVPDIAAVYREVSRVMRPGGLYISQHKQPTSLQVLDRSDRHGEYALNEPYYREGPLPSGTDPRIREEGTLEYLHRWEELLGYLCRAGFVIEDLSEPMHAKPDSPPGSFGHRGRFIAPYVRIKARRTGPAHDSGDSTRLIVPE